MLRHAPGRQDRLLGPATGFRQEGIDQAWRPFLVVGRKEIEPAPELVPERDAIENDPSMAFVPWRTCSCGGQGTFFEIGNDPEAEITLCRRRPGR